jgi:hypothetical protein
MRSISGGISGWGILSSIFKIFCNIDMLSEFYWVGCEEEIG